jgi:hypothetical protein
MPLIGSEKLSMAIERDGEELFEVEEVPIPPKDTALGQPLQPREHFGNHWGLTVESSAQCGCRRKAATGTGSPGITELEGSTLHPIRLLTASVGPLLT